MRHLRLREVGWVWKRAKLLAKDDDPQRVTRLARIRYRFEQLRLCEAMVFADELDIHLLPKVGCAWMPKGTQLEARYPADRYTRLYVVVDTYTIHQAQAVEEWLAAHPRVTLLFLPTYCPRANPMERAYGDGHDGCTRNHQRKRLPDLVADVEDHRHLNGPWKYKLSELYYEPAVTAAVENIAAEDHANVAA